MQTHLFRLLLISCLHACALVSYGQAASASNAPKRIPEPLCIVNSTIIANGGMSGLDVTKLKSVVVYKSNDDQDTPALLRGLASTGIIAITYDGKVGSTSFARLGRQHGAKSPFRVVINGQLLDGAQQKTLRIIPEAVGQLQVIPASATTSQALVTIQLAKAKLDTTKRPPGTIMIRGVAQK
ncbi:hypothetical protein [Hymenobacter cellulosivorans]|uniref:Plug domain-containing protein n=1 Tax=Hymenobacter cellulosivorans TaxID=2932249 RepID=A0ABY4F914_9BACT|nr:hypothetical protein [Hymenobacter cellulosivorans]UOQ52910.1 hypothetical protein MUN80_24610 [Hymenobacter cellulosivorans]